MSDQLSILSAARTNQMWGIALTYEPVGAMLWNRAVGRIGACRKGKAHLQNVINNCADA
jgi:hypothetical protein